KIVKEVSKKSGGKRKKTLARKRTKDTASEETSKKQKMEEDVEKEDLKFYLDIVPQDVVAIFVLSIYRYKDTRHEGYDLMLWGDLYTLFEPNE
ncbi:hypothetical protein Tco_0580056, partial [Tanacetum coccineum]